MTIIIGIWLFAAAIGLAALAAMALASALFTRRTARKVERLLPSTGQFVTVGGCRLHYVDHGAGPAVLMIHGLGGQLRHFTSGMTAQLTGRHRVVVVDRPGSGGSTRPPGSHAGLRAQAEAIAGLIDTLALERPLIVGHSLGGAVALTLAVLHPDRVGGLALIAPLSSAETVLPQAFRALAIGSPAARRLFAHVLAVPLTVLLRRATMRAVFGPEAAPLDYPLAGGGLSTLRPSQFLAAAEDLQALPDELPTLAARFREIEVPVRVLFSKEDRILDWRRNGAALVDRLPRGCLELVAGGHMLPVTQPAATAEFVRRAQAAVEQSRSTAKP